MSFTTDDIAKILKQPGYAVAPGSLWEPTAQQGGGLAETGLNGAIDTKTYSKTSAPSLWPSERHFQAAVIAECDRRAVLEPEYGLVCHIPNENSHKQPGVRAGMPDLFLPCARGGHVGLWLELKCGSNKPTPAQLGMIYKLRMEGHRCHIIWDSLDEVMGVIEDYLKGDA